MVGTPGTSFVSVLELGAGTGKLTRSLVTQRYHVFATDPDDAMLDVLSSHLPDVRATKAVAEQLPVPDQSVDVVVAAQAFHWFDLDRALPEIARVLKPGGHVALAWNQRDESIPWVRKLGAIIEQPNRDVDPTAALEASGHFIATEHAAFPFWQEVDRETLVDLSLSRSGQLHRSDEERAETQARVEALYDDYGRGTGGMRLPYVCEVWRAKVTEKRPVTPPMPTTLITSAGSSGTDTAVALPRVLDGYRPPGDEPGTDEIKLFTWH